MRAQGFALLAAIFLIMVIGMLLVLLSVIAVRSSEQQQQQLRSVEVRLAAQAGLEIALQRLAAQPGRCFSQQDVPLSDMPDVQLSISCRVDRYQKKNQAINLYHLSVQALSQQPADGQPLYARLLADAEQPVNDPYARVSVLFVYPGLR